MRDTRRRSGVSLALLLLVGVAVTVAGGAAATATATATAGGAAVGAQDQPGDAELTDGGSYFVGQLLFTDQFDAGTTLTLRRGDGSFVSDVVVGDDGIATVRTARRSAGSYVLSGPDQEIAFDLVAQELVASASPSSVSGDSAPVEVSVESNRAGYTLVISSTALSASALADRSDALTMRDGQAVLTDASTEETFTVDFGGLPDDEYTLSLGVADTTATSAVRVTVGSGGGSASFDQRTITEQVGDVARVPVTFSDRSEATLTVGDPDIGWRVRLTVEDADGDGAATVLINTDNALQGGPVFSAAGLDRVRDVQRLDGERFDDPAERLDPGLYPLRLTVGEQTDTATLTLQDPVTVERSVTAGRAPEQATATEAATDPELSAPADGAALSVADGDWVVIRVRAAGVFGSIDDVGDLAGDGTDGVSLSVSQTGTAGGGTDVLDDGGFVLVPRPERNLLLVVGQTDGTALEVGATYEATLEIAASNPFVGQSLERSDRFAVAEPTLSVDAPGDRVGVPATAGAAIVGSTNLANGSELAVSVRSSGDAVEGGESVRETAATRVNNGTWRVVVDLSGAAPGQELTIEIARPGEPSTTTVAGVVTRPPALTFPDQTADGGRVLTVEDVSLPNGGFVAVYERAPAGDAPRPLGTSTFLSPGEYDEVTVTLDDPLAEQRDLVAVVHRDDTDGVFGFVTSGGERDRPYALDGQPVSDGATVEAQDDTTTATATETQTATETRTPTETDGGTPTETETQTATATATATATETDDEDGLLDGAGSPGFGVVAALAALLGAAVLLARRR